MGPQPSPPASDAPTAAATRPTRSSPRRAPPPSTSPIPRPSSAPAEPTSSPGRVLLYALLLFGPVVCGVMLEDILGVLRAWWDGSSSSSSSSSSFSMVDDSDQTLVPKLTAMAVLGLASLTLGLGPLKLAVWLDWEQPSRRKSSNEPAEALHNHGGKGGSRLLSALLCFGGGVLMCTTFLHMLPEVQEAFTELGHDNVISESMAATAPHLLMCIGFFIMYLVEELVHLYLHRRAHKHGHGHGDGRDDNLNNLKVQNNLALIDEEESVMTSPIKSLQWSAKDSKPSSVILEYADGSQVKSEVPVEFLVAGVTFTSPWGIGALDKQYVRVDAERPRCQFTPRLSTCHKVHHDHNLEPELGNLPGFMAGANHHSHAIPVSGPAADGGAGATGLDEDPVVSALRGLLIVLALSVHELFEGLAVGLEAVAGNVWYMLAAVACHKLVIAFCIGVELVSMHTKVLLHVLYVTTFAVVSPLGIGVGILVTSKYGDIEGGVLPSVLQGLATGTLLYVVFFEILERQRACGHSGLQQYLAVLTGFLVMYAMSFIGGEHHHHHHHDGGEEVNSTFAVLHA